MARRSNRQNRRDYRSRLDQSDTSTASDRRSTEFKPDYSHVIADLRRIGINAGICLTILIILAIIF